MKIKIGIIFATLLFLSLAYKIDSVVAAEVDDEATCTTKAVGDRCGYNYPRNAVGGCCQIVYKSAAENKGLYCDDRIDYYPCCGKKQGDACEQGTAKGVCEVDRKNLPIASGSYDLLKCVLPKAISDAESGPGTCKGSNNKDATVVVWDVANKSVCMDRLRAEHLTYLSFTPSGGATDSSVAPAASVSNSNPNDYGDVNLSPIEGVSGGLVPCGNGTNDPCTLCHFIIGFQNLVNFMLKLVITMAFVGIFAAGVMYMISAGDDKMMGSAKSALTASLIGFGIVMGAWLIVNVTIWALGANIGVATGQNWYEFNCSKTPSSAPTSFTEGKSCGVVGPTSATCVNGWWYAPCPNGQKHLDPDICEGGLYCCGPLDSCIRKPCKVNTDCCEGTTCDDTDVGKICMPAPKCRAKGEQCNPASNAAPQTKCCVPGVCEKTGADNSELSSTCVLP